MRQNIFDGGLSLYRIDLVDKSRLEIVSYLLESGTVSIGVVLDRGALSLGEISSKAGNKTTVYFNDLQLCCLWINKHLQSILSKLNQDDFK